MSVYNAILSAVATTITGLGLSYNTSTIPVKIRKLPKADETIDTLPLICVSPHERPERVTQASFESQVNVEYRVQVTLIAAGNRDVSSNLDTEAGWREQIRRAFQAPPLSGVATVWKVNMEPEVFLDRTLLNLNYDYQSIAVNFHSMEQRGN